MSIYIAPVKKTAPKFEYFISLREFMKIAKGPARNINHLIICLIGRRYSHFVHLTT